MTSKEQSDNLLPQTSSLPAVSYIGNHILAKLISNPVSLAFRYPVDPYEDGVFDYFEHIKSPMDLQTIRLRLERGKYEQKEQFYNDIELIILNSRVYHKNNPQFLHLTRKFENLYKKLRREVDPLRKKKMDLN